MKQNRPVPHWIRMRTGNTITFEFFFSYFYNPFAFSFSVSISFFSLLLTWDQTKTTLFSISLIHEIHYSHSLICWWFSFFFFFFSSCSLFIVLTVCSQLQLQAPQLETHETELVKTMERNVSAEHNGDGRCAVQTVISAFASFFFRNHSFFKKTKQNRD